MSVVSNLTKQFLDKIIDELKKKGKLNKNSK